MVLDFQADAYHLKSQISEKLEEKVHEVQNDIQLTTRINFRIDILPMTVDVGFCQNLAFFQFLKDIQ